MRAAAIPASLTVAAGWWFAGRRAVSEIQNFTGQLERAEAFLRAKCALISTEGLSIHIKHTKARGRDVNGYYRFADRRIVVAVKRRLKYPRKAAYGVGSVSVARRSPRARPFKLVWHEERFDGPDELLAFVAGHEVWHFLCHSGQRKGDYETKANCNGFLWLTEFKCWAGPGHAVEPIPALPPRPDHAEPEPQRRRWIQYDLFSFVGVGAAAAARQRPPSPARRASRRGRR